MTTKYRTKNALTIWWDQAPRPQRIAAGIGAGIVGLLLLAGLAFLVKSLFHVQPEDEGRARTTIALPAQGVEASETPSAMATPELPPLNLPEVTPEPSATPTREPSFDDDRDGPPATITPNDRAPLAPDTGLSPTPGRAPRASGDLDGVVAQVRQSCLHAELATASTGEPLVRAIQQWGSGDFTQIVPCVEKAIELTKDGSTDIEFRVQTETQPAGYLYLRGSDVRDLSALSPEDRVTRLREAFQVAPNLQLK